MKIDLPIYDAKHKKVHLVALKLKGGASAWWDQVAVNQQKQGRQTIRSWEKMKKLMKQRFLPPNYEQTLYTQYQNCRQGYRKTAEYIEEFHRLGARTNLMESEQHLIARFTGGLRMDLREKVKLQRFQWLSEVIAYPETVEEMVESQSKFTRKGFWETSTSKNTLAPQAINKAKVIEKDKEPEKKDDHNSKEETTEANKKSRNPYNRPFSGTCYRCGQAGHPSISYPQEKTVAFVDDEELIQGSNEEDEQDAELIEADEGDNLSCVLQKVLIAPKEHQPQSHSLFKTRCTVQGKICNVIIDSGSSENFVSKE
ncbi:uncharacterized protein E5676_scaffold154G00410 [Cucumis melo var. makuwa]|uniref:Retrotransposon gag domain-containing protein n=1 Tax=Cucumis melo var. makuwa TaxID=1194695 RepID=A0A5D3D655_CUCMM|nr:uncharacterized protein E6C27_scaffold36G001170 [Cucumis melo var. makuwa]TYK19015.1 uncharacterized protein E5676_scaffold154G00410 [Cucumis melo var. makuwa]